MNRFWNKVKKTHTCWNWTGASDPKGYGKFQMNGKLLYAHRVSYILAYGFIPKGKQVCHHCDNPSCVRPDHLFLGSNLDNVRDSILKGRWTIGERNGNSVLTEAKVRSIRKEYAEGNISQRALAKKYGIHQVGIWGIVNDKIWKHVKEIP